jgi:hypothetical protein
MNDITKEKFKEFCNEMYRILEEHEAEKGDDWQETPDDVLVSNLFEEIREFTRKDNPELELIDISNSCFILWAKRKYFKQL